MSGRAVLERDFGFAFNEGLGSEVVNRERFAGVGFNGGIAHDPHAERSRRNLDLSVDPPYVQPVGHIDAGSIADDQFVGGRRDRTGRDVGGRSARSGSLFPVACGQIGNRDVGAMRFAVVGEDAADGGDDDRLVVLGHHQRADIRFNLIVGFLGAAAPVDIVRVLRACGRIDLGGRAGGGESGGFTVHQAGHRAGSRERGTVIGLGGRERRHLESSRLDCQRALDVLDHIAVSHVFSGPVLENSYFVLVVELHRIVAYIHFCRARIDVGDVHSFVAFEHRIARGFFGSIVNELV